MASLTILIVEDEIVIARDIQEQLQGFGYENVTIAKNSQIAITAFNELQPDLVLMDIILKNSELDGIQIAHVFNSLKKIPIIYLTSSDNPKVYERAKVTAPANFLFKPCNEKQLNAAINLAIHNFSNQKEAIPQQTAIESHDQELFLGKDCIFIRDRDLFIKIDFENILWVEAANAYVEIHTPTDKHLVTGNLKNFLAQINYKSIQRVHRSFAVNLPKVQAFDGGNLYIKKNDKDHRIPVAPKSRDSIFSLFPKLRTRL